MRAKINLLVLVLALCLAQVPLLSFESELVSASPDPSWNIETVGNGIGWSIALDSHNRPYICYSSYPDFDLKYINWAGTTWSVKTITTRAEDASMVLDSFDRPHISYVSYYYPTNQDLKYARRAETKWSIETVDTGDFGYAPMPTALDSANHPHICYTDLTNFDLKYAKSIGTTGEVKPYWVSVNSYVKYQADIRMVEEGVTYVGSGTCTMTVKEVREDYAVLGFVDDQMWSPSPPPDYVSEQTWDLSYRELEHMEFVLTSSVGLGFQVLENMKAGILPEELEEYYKGIKNLTTAYGTVKCFHFAGTKDDVEFSCYWDYDTGLAIKHSGINRSAGFEAELELLETNIPVALTAPVNQSPTTPSSPYCEGEINPTDVTDLTPEFSAVYEDPDEGDKAIYYEIEVDTSPDFTGTRMWDTGKTSMASLVEGSICPEISYARTSLSLDGSTYYWRIRFWDGDGAQGEWSATQNFTMKKTSYELFIEIDYMPEHEPTQSVLDYVRNYYLDRDISVTFFVDDEVPLDSEVTRSEFFDYEATYNDLGDDEIVRRWWWWDDYKLTSKWKWVLFGTVDGGGANGYCYGNEDAGNYIFIADESNDDFASEWEDWGVTSEEVETVVLMHELGHAIGILRLINGEEDYDLDHEWSVMSLLSDANCNADPIRYSQEYWELRNMEYYVA